MTDATSSENPVRPFAAPYAPPDEDLAASWLRRPDDRAADARIDAMATRLVMAIRAKTGGLGGIEDFLHAYSLSTRRAWRSWCWRRRCCGCPMPPPPTA